MTSPPPPKPLPLGCCWGEALGSAGMYLSSPQRQPSRLPAEPPALPPAADRPPVTYAVTPRHRAPISAFWHPESPVSPHLRMTSRMAHGAFARLPPREGSDDPSDLSAFSMHSHTSCATQMGVRLALAWR